MINVTIHEAKTHLSRLIEKALTGEEIIISKGNTPLVKMVALPETKITREFGTAKGLVKFMADDFNAPLEYY